LKDEAQLVVGRLSANISAPDETGLFTIFQAFVRLGRKSNGTFTFSDANDKKYQRQICRKQPTGCRTAHDSQSTELPHSGAKCQEISRTIMA
jgi:hypothetical protein